MELTFYGGSIEPEYELQEPCRWMKHFQVEMSAPTVRHGGKLQDQTADGHWLLFTFKNFHIALWKSLLSRIDYASWRIVRHVNSLFVEGVCLAHNMTKTYMCSCVSYRGVVSCRGKSIGTKTQEISVLNLALPVTHRVVLSESHNFSGLEVSRLKLAQICLS